MPPDVAELQRRVGTSWRWAGQHAYELRGVARCLQCALTACWPVLPACSACPAEYVRKCRLAVGAAESSEDEGAAEGGNGGGAAEAESGSDDDAEVGGREVVA